MRIKMGKQYSVKKYPTLETALNNHKSEFPKYMTLSHINEEISVKPP
jgi:hypothetical protein